MIDLVRTYGFLTLGTRLKRLGERMQAETQKMIDSRDDIPIVASQFPYLAAIDAAEALTIGDLADALEVTQPAVTRTITQLVEAGLVTTEPAPDDQRRRIIRLSAHGKALLDHSRDTLWPAIEASVRDLCGHLEGPLLDQLAAIENGLDQEPLLQRSLKLLRQENTK